ncbi:MAG: Na/Pi symporter, partial [Clostridia bacterium]
VIKKVGAILSGIGILFVGLTVMSDSMEVLKDNPAIREVLLNTSNPFLLLIFGTALTAVIQSSSATTTIVISLAGSGLMTLRSAIFTTLGINIGTCVTALLASIGATTNAKRTSVILLSFNVIGCALFFTIFMCLPQAFFTTMEGWFNGVIETQIAMFHTFFNVVTTILLLPFVKQLPKLASLIVRDKKSKVPATVEDDTTKKLTYIDNRLVATPSIAIMMARKEIIGMFELAKKNLDMSVDMITTLDLSSKENFENREIKIDYLNAETTKFLIKISTERISYINEKELASYYHALSDIERVGDYAENIVEYAQELTNYKTTFSETAIAQIREMNEAINNLYACVHDSFVNRDISTLRLVADLEEVVDRFQEKLERDHIDRMIQNLCPAQAASVFLSLISNMERIADHIRNVF